MKLLNLIYLVVFLSGCAAIDQPPSYNPHRDESYVARGNNRTFAIYNSAHRLISHPIEDLLEVMKLRRLAGLPPISDIYVISHGWNYTLPVSIANYHTYIQIADNFQKRNRESIEKACEGHEYEINVERPANNKCWQPYFIFISWISTVRPLTDAINAILPFGLDSSLRPVSSLIDKVPAHLLTAWKQSLNASQNALGSKYPNHYLLQDWKSRSYGYSDQSLIEDSDVDMGEDIPVSSLLYKLIQMKSVKPSAGKECLKNELFHTITSPVSDVCVSLDQSKIHLAGHSYGAKLLSLASMEAIRRWLLEDSIEQGNLVRAIEDVDNQLWTDSGHTWAFGVNNRQKKRDIILATYEKKIIIPIDSLILFNPAFIPNELYYNVGPALFNAPTETLRFIPNKVIIYSNSDSANGGLFNVRDMILNTDYAQTAQQLTNHVQQWQKDRSANLNKYIRPVFYPSLIAGNALSGVLIEVLSGLIGVTNHAIQASIDTPYDWWHHITTNKLFGHSDLVDLDPSKDNISRFIASAGNVIDFFAPPLHLEEEQQQGFYRLTRPGLGKTGINNLGEGRANYKLGGLAPYYVSAIPFDKDTTSRMPGYDNMHPFAPKVDARDVADFAGTDRIFNCHNNTDWECPGNATYADMRGLREKFFSFDASRIYDSSRLDPFVGSHSDLRDTDPPKETSTRNITPEGRLLDKRGYTFNLLLNITKTDFEKTLIGLREARLGHHDKKTVE